MAAHIAYA